MRIIAKRTLQVFWNREPGSRAALVAWYRETKRAHWAGPADVKAENATASILQVGRVVFNIRGNRYRLVVRINYAYEIVYVRFVGTHADHDDIDSQSI